MVEQKSSVIGPSTMLPITIGDFEKAISKARAEVLASVEKHLIKAGNFEAALDNMGDWLRKEIRSVQPAASDLEALLREERGKHRIEVLYEVRRQLVRARNIHGLEQAKEILTVEDAASLLWWIDERTKEKARAEGKG